MAQVDAFLGAIRDTFAGVRKPPVTADEVRNEQFMTTRLRPGYDEEEVDAFLDQAEARLRARCAECGTEAAKATQYCPGCRAPVAKQRSVAAEPAADGPGTAMATRHQTHPAGHVTPQDAPTRPVGQRAGHGHLPRSVWAIFGLVIIAPVVVITVVASSTSPPPSPSARQTSPPPSPSARQLTADQLQPGDCLTGSNLGLGTSSNWPDQVTAVPCTRRHLAEVFFTGNVWPQSLAYPGDNAVGNQADARCSKAFRAYDGIANSESAFTFDYIVPADASDWASGDRLMVCIAWEQPQPGAPVNYSIKGSRR
jgi:DivIVA domain-containing protein